MEPGVVMATQYFKRNLLLNLYREGEKIYIYIFHIYSIKYIYMYIYMCVFIYAYISLVCFLLPLKRDKSV